MLVDLLKNTQIRLESGIQVTSAFVFSIFSFGLLSVEKNPEKLTPKGQS